MKLGVALPTSSPYASTESIVRIAQEAERLGYNSVWTKERGKRVEEYIAALRAIWGPDPVSHDGSFYHIPASKINPKPVQQGGIPILMGVSTPAAIQRAARLADIINPIATTFADLESTVTAFLSAAQKAGRDISALKVIVRANVPITAASLPEGKRPFLGGSPEQIAQDLARVQQLNVDEVFFSDGASLTVDDAVQRLETLQSIVR